MSITRLNIGRQSNQHFDENADGFTVGGGTTQRDLTLTGGDVTVTGSGSDTYTYPSGGGTLVVQDDLGDLATKDTASFSDTTGIRNYVFIEPVSVLDINPSTNSFTDLDLSTVVSADAVAVHGVGYITTTGTGRNLNVRRKGSTKDQPETIAVRSEGSGSAAGMFIVGLDASKIMQWRVPNTDVSKVEIVIWGYYEER